MFCQSVDWFFFIAVDELTAIGKKKREEERTILKLRGEANAKTVTSTKSETAVTK